MMMIRKCFLTALTVMCVMTASAQWKVGVTGGVDYNVFSMDKQYMRVNDYRYNSTTALQFIRSGQ